MLTKLKPTRRWIQLSLRTTLVLVTLLCVALSLWVVPAERQRRAVAAIEALGEIVIYRGNRATRESFSVAFLRGWLPPVYVDEAMGLQMDQVTDAGLADLKELTGLRDIDLEGTQITDASLLNLTALSRLQAIDPRRLRSQMPVWLTCKRTDGPSSPRSQKHAGDRCGAGLTSSGVAKLRDHWTVTTLN
jgi:hypothetical protein